MTKTDLQQYQHIKGEIEDIKRQIKNVRCYESENYVTDSVVGSYDVFPYTEHKITIKGYDTGYDVQIKKLQTELNKRLNELFYTERRVSNFVAGIDDSEMRRIITLRYVEGLTWQQVANRIGESDESYPRRKCNRFLKLAENAEN